MRLLRATYNLVKLITLLSLSVSGLVHAANNALDFDGTNDYLTVSDHSSLDVTGDIAIQAWIEPDSVASDAILVLKSTGGNAVDMSYALRLPSAGRIKMELSGGSGSNFDGAGNVFASCTTALNTISAGNKYHIVGYRNGREIGIYINGALACQDTTAIATGQLIQASNASVAIGRFPSFGQEFDGQIDEVAIWKNDTLTAAEITALYNSGSGLDATVDSGNYSASSTLTAYWKMNEGTGSSTTDSSTSSNTATITGATWEASVLTETTAPTVSSVSSDKAAGAYTTGEVIDVDVTFSEAVTVTGTPQITLETGSTDQVVNILQARVLIP